LFVLSSGVRVLEWPSGEPLAALEGMGDSGWSLAVDPAGRLVVACAWGAVPVAWEGGPEPSAGSAPRPDGAGTR